MLGFLFLLSFSIIGHARENTGSSRNYRVVVLHSYDAGFPSYSNLNNEIASNFKSKNMDADFRYFYLDCEKYENEEEIQRSYNFIDSIQAWNPDIILANDDQVVYSTLRSAHPFLRKVPFVFAGVSFPNWDLIAAYPNVTGFWDKADYLKNIQMAEDLLGPTRILFYHDMTFLGKQVVRDIALQIHEKDQFTYEILQKYIQGNFDDSILEPLNPVKEILRESESNQHPEKTEILFPNFYSRLAPDALWILSGLYKNAVFVQTKYDYRVLGMGRMSAVPALSVLNEGVGYGQGILGGYLTPLHIQASEQVGYAVRLLQGESIENLPIAESEKKYVVDWVELKRWDIPLKTVPAHYEIVNIPFYAQYKSYLVFAGILLGIILLTIIFGLMYLYSRESKYKREAQRNLLREKELLSLSLEESNIYSWKYDGKQKVFCMDKEFFEGLKIPSRTFSVEQIHELTHPEDRDFALEKFNSVRSGQQPKSRLNCRVDFNGHGYTWYEFRFNNVESKLGDHISIIGLIIDVQEYKEREKELAKARDLAAQAELKESFLARISHEVRTPLNAIVGFSNLLANDEDLDTEDKLEYVATINKNCDLLLKLINDILEISRIESGNMTFVFSITNLTTLFEDMYAAHQDSVPQDIKFVMELPDEPVYINVDVLRLKQVITNFINNAFKFTTQGRIMIGYYTDPEKKQVYLYVEDTGKGISEDEQKIIFQSFYKKDEFVQGAGLGLSLSHVIIEKLGGKIVLDSAVGKGSCFTIVLPYSPGEQGAFRMSGIFHA